MKSFICKLLTPWLAEACFETEAAFRSWLGRRQTILTNVRILCLVIAVIPLLAGYVLDRHSIMLLTILPLALVLLTTVQLERIEQAVHGQNK